MPRLAHEFSEAARSYTDEVGWVLVKEMPVPDGDSVAAKEVLGVAPEAGRGRCSERN